MRSPKGVMVVIGNAHPVERVWVRNGETVLHATRLEIAREKRNKGGAWPGRITHCKCFGALSAAK
jgi:hypothetical protein